MRETAEESQALKLRPFHVNTYIVSLPFGRSAFNKIKQLTDHTPGQYMNIFSCLEIN